MTAGEAHYKRAGLIMVALAALAWSSGGLFVRAIQTDLATMLFWRGLFSGAAVMSFFFWLEGNRAMAVLRQLRWPAFAVAVASAVSMITGIGALQYTSIADALVIYATVPFVTAALAWATIGERPALHTMLASLAALIGVAVMLGGSFADAISGAALKAGLFGKFLAVFMALGMATMTIIMRKHQDVPMLPAVGLSAWICSGAVFAFASPLGINANDFWLCAAFGLFQNASGLALYALGSRRVPAAEATLIAALEVPLTPLWVWMVFGETPALATLLGGSIVLTAMFVHIYLETRRFGRPTP
ncbi:MAG: DMT family transporter [Rhizobiales bacterium]|nr:DMT family transporter [Hyphomicrobiales bacterium]